MDRRSLLNGGLGALLTTAIAQPGRSQPQAANAASAPIAIASENLQWLRAPDDIAHAAIEAGFGALVLSCGPAPAHVALGDGKALASFVTALRNQGIAVDTVSCPADLTAETSGLDDFLGAAAAAGITRYAFGPYPYAANRPLETQMQECKARLASLAKLNARYRVRGLYRNRAGLYHGALLFDLLESLHGLDPKTIGICFDSGQAALAAGNNSWVSPLGATSDLLGAVLCTDTTLHFQIDTDQGGAFMGTPEQLEARPPTDLRRFGGGGGQTNPWISPNVPLGTGLVDLPALVTTLKKIWFHGPLIVQSDYANGGSENGGQTLSLPKAMVLGAIKRDLLALKAALSAGGLG